MEKLKKVLPFILFFLIVLFFFSPIFKGFIPFPGDLLVNVNPYKSESFLGYNPGSYPNKAQGGDVLAQIYPWRFFSMEQLKNGSLPLWNPYNFSGNPQLANLQTGFFYPLNILYLILPFNLAWTAIIIHQPLFAAIFMYLFLKKGLSLSKYSSFIGGNIFAFCSYSTVWMEYGNIVSSFMWLPLALLFTKRIIEKTSSFNFAALSIALTFSVLAGYIQSSFYIYVFCLIYAAYLVKNSSLNKKRIFYFILALVVPLLISAIQLFPTIELFKNSTRFSYTIDQISQMLLPPYLWIALFFPDFFGNPATRNYWISGTYIERVMYFGTIGLFFSIYSIIAAKENIKRFFLIFGLIIILLTSSLPLVSYFYSIPLPVLSTTVPTRMLSLFIFCFIVLTAIGINNWEKNKKFSKFPILIGLIFIAFTIGTFFSSIFLNDLNLRVSFRNTLIPTTLVVLTVLFFYLKARKITYLFLTLLVLVDLFFFFNKITPFSPKSFTFPKTPLIAFLKENAGINRFWGYGGAYIPSNYQTVDKIYSPEGNDPLHINSYGELLASSGNGEIDILPRQDTNIVNGFGREYFKNDYRQKILNLLGVKYIINESIEKNPDLYVFPKEEFDLVFHDKNWQVYENKKALPRFFLIDDYSVMDEKRKILAAIYSGNINLREKVILEKEPVLGIEKSQRKEIALVSYSPNEVVFNTDSDNNTILFLSDNYFPGWQAMVDDKETEILKANYSFRAVAVPSGKHRVVMQYIPGSFELGKRVSLIGVFFLLLITLKLRYEK